MTIRDAIDRAIRRSGFPSDKHWALAKGISVSTLHDIKRRGTATGANLAKLQKAGVTIARKDVIASLDPNAAPADLAKAS